MNRIVVIVGAAIGGWAKLAEMGADLRRRLEPPDMEVREMRPPRLEDEYRAPANPRQAMRANKRGRGKRKGR